MAESEAAVTLAADDPWSVGPLLALTRALEADEVIRALVDAVRSCVPAAQIAVLVPETPGNVLRIAATVGAPAGQWDATTVPLRDVPDAANAPAVLFSERADRSVSEPLVPWSIPGHMPYLLLRFMENGRPLAYVEAFQFPSAPDAVQWSQLQRIVQFGTVALSNVHRLVQLRQLIITDDCTGLFNSRYLFQVVETEVYRSQRFGNAFTCLFLDLDHFKQVNDTHGHLVGSRLLREVGDLLVAELRKIDYVFRYGGDEFVIVLPLTPKEQGAVVAYRILRRFRGMAFLAESGLNLKLTVSIGLAAYPVDAVTATGLIRRADEMMYQVKRSSRDGLIYVGTEA
jgi:diguanylate cyclase (GGDEF)-like protein